MDGWMPCPGFLRQRDTKHTSFQASSSVRTWLGRGPWHAVCPRKTKKERGLLRSACGRRPRSHAHLQRHPLDNPIDTRRLIRAPDVCPSRHLIRRGQILVLGQKEAKLPCRRASAGEQPHPRAPLWLPGSLLPAEPQAVGCRWRCAPGLPLHRPPSRSRCVRRRAPTERRQGREGESRTPSPAVDETPVSHDSGSWLRRLRRGHHRMPGRHSTGIVGWILLWIFLRHSYLISN